jgi:two-component system, NarL family, invasion response regulator UvrY
MRPVILVQVRRDPATADTEATGEVGVLIVDDQAPFRAVARTVIDIAAGFTVVGEAASGEEAVEMAAALHPSMVLMDINLPGINGIEATRRIVAADPGTVVVMLSTYRADDLPSDAADCGAARYIHKEDFGPAILQEIWSERSNR